MKPGISGAVAVAVRAWHRFVTAGLPAELRDRRREEIESDLWESRHQSRRSDGLTALHMLWRLASGAPHDVAWRLAQPRRSWLLLPGTATVLVCLGLAAGLQFRVGTVELPAMASPPSASQGSTRRPPPPPPPPPPPTPSAAVAGAALQPVYAHVSYRIEGGGPTPAMTQQVRPQYPPVLQAANVRGTVVIVATLTRSGRLTNVRAARSSLLLTQAALDAVQQWRFASTASEADRDPQTLTVTVSFGV